MAKTEIQLPFSSRLKKTRVYSDRGRVFFGIWKPPTIRLDGDEELIRIPEERSGSLDLYAHEYYGDRALWWAIAYVNNIKNPQEVVAGKTIIIPKPENVRAALLETESAPS